MNEKQNDHVLSTADVAELLAVPRRTARHWMATGKLDGFRLPSGWRTTPDALKTFIEREDRQQTDNDEKDPDR